MSGTLHLAKAQSNGGPGGRKKDFPDAEGLVKRLVAQELTLSFVPDTGQRLWRTVRRRKYQITRNRRGERGQERQPLLPQRQPPDFFTQGIRYERGPAVSEEAKKVRARKMIRGLRSLGYRVEPVAAPSSSRA